MNTHIILCILFSLLSFSLQKGLLVSAAEELESFFESFITESSDANFEMFLKGLFTGIGESKTPDDLKKCLKSTDEVITAIKTGLEECRPMTKEAINSGLIKIMNGFKLLFIMIDPCMSGYNSLKKLETWTAKPDYNKLISKAMGRIGAFFHLVMNSLEGFIREDYNMAGKGLGDLCMFLFAGRLIKNTEEGDKAQTMEEFAKGFLDGVEGKTDITELKACLKESNTINATIIAGLETCRPMTAEAIKEGLKGVFKGANDYLVMIKPCYNNFANLKKLVDFIAKADFNKIISKIQRTIGQFFHLVMNSLEGYLTNDYKMAGKGLGDLMKYLFFASAEESDDFAEQLLSIFNFQKLEEQDKDWKEGGN